MTERSDFWKEQFDKRRYYGEPGIYSMLGNVLESLLKSGKIGTRVVDVGSGSVSFAKHFLQQEPGWLASRIAQWGGNERNVPGVLTIDIGGQLPREDHAMHLKADIRTQQWEVLSKYMRAKIGTFFEIPKDELQESAIDKVDTMLFSQILNYVDYQELLHYASAFLKKGGRFVIAEMPGRGEPSMMPHEHSLESMAELRETLEKLGFQVELPKKGWIFKDNNDFTVFVARKERDPDPQFLKDLQGRAGEHFRSRPA